MATFTTSIVWTNSSDANFRIWGSYVAAKLLASGLVQTSDTGQINWTTVLTPAGINTYQGYEIWRLADTLQATAPIYLKIEYGEGTVADNPAIRYTVGTGSNGTGSLTGTTSTVTYAASAASASAITVYGSGDTSRFVLAIQLANGMVFSFERTKDASGADTAEGLVVLTASGSLTAASVSSIAAVELVYDPSIGDRTRFQGTIGALFPNASTFISGAQTGVAPILPEKPIFMNPVLNLIGYYSGDISGGNTIGVYMYGVIHQYQTLTAGGFTTISWRGVGGGTEAMALRYE